MIGWDCVSHPSVLRVIDAYDRLGPRRFFSKHGFASATMYELVWEGRIYPPKSDTWPRLRVCYGSSTSLKRF